MERILLLAPPDAWDDPTIRALAAIEPYAMRTTVVIDHHADCGRRPLVQSYDVVIIVDDGTPWRDAWLQRFATASPPIPPLIVVGWKPSLRGVIAALRARAAHYVLPPPTPDDVRACVDSVLGTLRAHRRSHDLIQRIIRDSHELRRLFAIPPRDDQRAAPVDDAFDHASFMAFVERYALLLPEAERALLHALASHPDTALTFDDIAAALMRFGKAGTRLAIRSSVFRLRQWLRHHTIAHVAIVSVRGFGYMLDTSACASAAPTRVSASHAAHAHAHVHALRREPPHAGAMEPTDKRPHGACGCTDASCRSAGSHSATARDALSRDVAIQERIDEPFHERT